MCVAFALATSLASPAWADEAAAKILKLNKQALDAFDNLNFDQAKTLLEQALAESDAADLGNSPVNARSHLNLGMLLIAGFQQRDLALDHFKAALKIQPDITAPAGLFNPEVQSAFDEVRSNMKTQPAPPPVRATKKTAPAKPDRAAEAEAVAGHDGDNEEEEETDNAGSKVLLSLGLGSGLGIAKGHLDANNGSVQDSSWSGGLAPSRLGHVMLGVGYFVSPDLMLSLDGRIQVVSGTTIVKGTAACNPSCSAPSTGIAVLARASWFLSSGPVRPFISGGVGAGAIRQVVKINVVQGGATGTAATPTTGCGDTGTDPCVDTVTGGPLLLAVGGGVAYEIGSLALLGSLTANVGVPNVMLNIDALLGLGLRL